MVDENMIERTKQFLIGRKDGKGGFQQSDKALDSFGRAPANITNAYIVWALTSSGYTDLNNEIDNLIAIARSGLDSDFVDPYFFSLLAASLYNLGRNEEGDEFAAYVIPY